jgi:hypothetical protein
MEWNSSSPWKTRRSHARAGAMAKIANSPFRGGSERLGVDSGILWPNVAPGRSGDYVRGIALRPCIFRSLSVDIHMLPCSSIMEIISRKYRSAEVFRNCFLNANKPSRFATCSCGLFGKFGLYHIIPRSLADPSWNPTRHGTVSESWVWPSRIIVRSPSSIVFRHMAGYKF